jgi:hypothetical protein
MTAPPSPSPSSCPAIDDGDYYNQYVLHAYYSLHDPEVLLWSVLGKRVELAVRAVATYATSRILDASALGLKETVLADMQTWTRLWMHHNGREDPRSEHHTPAYREAKGHVERLSCIIHTAVKAYYSAHPMDPTHE